MRTSVKTIRTTPSPQQEWRNLAGKEVAAHGWIAEHVLPLGAVRSASAVDLLRDLAEG